MTKDTNEFKTHKIRLTFGIITIFCFFGQGVDYGSMAHSNEFLTYIKHTAELQRVKLEGMTREETLAFFINIYNALVIHANVVRGPPVTLWQRYKVTACMLKRLESRQSTGPDKKIYLKFHVKYRHI